MKKILILDGNSIVNRAFFGVRTLSTREGLPTNAVYGFLTIIKKHLDTVRPDVCLCAFDVHQPTFRHLRYDGYKATRKPMPDELRVQMPYAKRAAADLGFRVIECPGYEADDVLGTVARMGDASGEYETYVLTGDRDSLQLISPHTTVILAKNKEDVYYNPSRFAEDYGVTPTQFIDVKALMGDSSDNIPGVAGIGEKTAFKLIQLAGSLDALYGDETFFGQSQSVVQKLENGRESAALSRELAEICRTAPIGTPDELFKPCPVDPADFAALCTELEFRGMPERFGLTMPDQPAAETPELTVTEVDSLAEIHVTDPAAVYYEHGQFAVSTGENTVTVCRAADAEAVQTSLRGRTVICHDYKSLLRSVRLSGDELGCAYDTMLAAYLLEPGKGKYRLVDQAVRYGAGEADTPESAAAAIERLYEITQPMLDESGMTKLMQEIELPLSVVLAEMEETGFRIDPDGICAYAEELRRQEESLADIIWMQAGHPFNINSPKQLGEVLFDEIGLPAGKKTKSGYSTDADTLEELRPYHTIIGDILLYRQVAKLRGTYGVALAEQADENGRIHTTFNQTGTATGRLASSDPNLQNIPVRGDLGRELRKYFIAADGCELIDADYSQIELRLLSVLSGDRVMQDSFLQGVDIHTAVASQVFGVPEEDVTPELRRRAKAVNFGIVYGIGDFSLSKDLGITRKMAKAYIDSYLGTYAGVDAYLKKTVADAHESGSTTTMFGRRRNIPELKSPNRNLRAFGERVAMNSPIQGTAADVIKIAMIRVRQALKDAGIPARLIMQVHDELIVEADQSCADQAAEILVTEMENAVRLAVPLLADCGRGENWLDAK